MGCDQFGHCVPDRPGVGVGVGIDIGIPRPGMPLQPGMQDPLRQEAFQLAQQLRDPRFAEQAMGQIQNEVRHLDRRGVRAFEFDLQQATGRPVLHEHPGMANGPQGPFRADFVDLTNPYTGEVRLGIKAMPAEIRPPIVAQPGYGPGYGQPGYGQPGYGQPGYGQPGYIAPVPSVGIGIVIGGRHHFP
jgi:hypothetical protein